MSGYEIRPGSETEALLQKLVDQLCQKMEECTGKIVTTINDVDANISELHITIRNN